MRAVAHSLYHHSSLVQLNKKCCKIPDFLLETTSQTSENSLLLKCSAIIKLCSVFIAGTLSSCCSLSWCKRQTLPRSKNCDPTMLQPSSDKCLDIIRVVFEKLSGYRIPQKCPIIRISDTGYIRIGHTIFNLLSKIYVLLNWLLWKTTSS